MHTAMSTTPSISKPHNQEWRTYTVVGKRHDYADAEGVSFVIPCNDRQAMSRNFFDSLYKFGAAEILLLISENNRFKMDEFIGHYDTMRYLVFNDCSNTGCIIDAAFREAGCAYLFILNNVLPKASMRPIRDEVLPAIIEEGRLCTVPVFEDDAGNIIPSLIGPLHLSGGQFDTHIGAPGKKASATLAPWIYCGVYRKDRHQSLGGFDPQIPEAWWQLLDYGMRAWLWGEEIKTHPNLRVSYTKDMVSVDTSVNPGYRRFFLKNLAIRFKHNTGYLPRSRWWSYLQHSTDNYPLAARDWRDIRQWIYRNRYCFMNDPAQLIRNWPWSEI